MRGRISQLLRGAVGWLLTTSLNRLAVAGIGWGLLIIALVFLDDHVIWLGFALGVLLPITLWVAWQGFAIPRNGRLGSFLALTPREFEETVADLIVPLGYSDIRVVGDAADLGVDVICHDREGRLVAIQCKRYQPGNDVSSSGVRLVRARAIAAYNDVMIARCSRMT